MKLIIDIPEVVKHKVYAYGLSLSPSDKEQLIKAIMNGIPLPTGHGRLIDESKIAVIIETEDGDDFITDAPTIIEADKESE